MDKIIYPNQLDYISSLRGEVDPLLKEMEEFAAVKKIPILNWNSAELLEAIILSQKPKRVLEIGTAIAYSSIRIARVLEENGILDTIEKSIDNIKLAMDYIKRSGEKSKINLIEGNALLLMPQFEDEYDFIFLDADKQDYEKLIFNSLVLLKKGGIIFVDNLLWHGYAANGEVPSSHINGAKQIREFNKIFVSQPNLKTTILPVGDGIGIGVKL
jgi:predicted O-methyltransferase YrrM